MGSNEMIFRTKAVLRINNFTELKANVISDHFEIGPDLWRLYINVKEDSIGVYIDVMKSTSETIDVQYVAYILTTDCQRMNVKDMKRKSIKLNEGFGAAFAKKSDLLDQMDTCLSNNTLTIGFNITVYKAINVGQANKVYSRNHFNNKNFSDCRLVVGDKELFASKAILSAHSEVFYKAFETNLSEKTTNDVIIKDIDPNVFKEFLRFLYFGDTEKLEDMAEELLYVSDKYMVSGLKTICENLYYLRINPKNAFEVLEVLDKYRNSSLKAKAIEFIKDLGFECLETQWHKIIDNNEPLIEQMIRQMKTDSKSKKLSHTMVYTYLPSF